MKAVQEENKLVTYQFAWWEVPKYQYAIWTAGCLVVIGGIWPTIINLLIGAGLGPKKKEEDYDLNRFGRGKTKTETAPAARRGMTTAEQSQLANADAESGERVGAEWDGTCERRGDGHGQRAAGAEAGRQGAGNCANGKGKRRQGI